MSQLAGPDGQAAEAQAGLGAPIEIASELPTTTTGLRELALDLRRRIAGQLKRIAAKGADEAVHALFGASVLGRWLSPAAI
jgi:hypothetical protein